MSDTSLWIGLLIGAAIIASAIAVLKFFERRRSHAMYSAAAQLKLEPLAKGERFYLASVELMRKKGRGVGAALRGTWKGRRVTVFDLFHPAGRSVSQQTVLAAEFPEQRFPEFAAIEKNAGYYPPTVDIPCATDAPAQLARHWYVRTPDGHWPFRETLAGWLGNGRGKRGLFAVGWSYEGHGTVLFVYRRGKLAPARELALWLDEAIAETEAFARHAQSSRDTVETGISDGAEGGFPRDFIRIKATVKVEKHYAWSMKGRERNH